MIVIGARRRHPVERLGARGECGQRVFQRRVAEVDGDRGLAERGIENDVQVRKARDRRKHHPAVGAVAESKRLRELYARRKLLAGRRQVAGPVDQRLQFRPAAARDRQFRPQSLPGILERGLHGAVAGVQLGCDLELDQRFFVAFRARETAATLKMVLRGAQACALERESCILVVRLRAGSLRVLNDSQVVVLQLFGALPGVEGAACRASGSQGTGKQRRTRFAGTPD